MRNSVLAMPAMTFAVAAVTAVALAKGSVREEAIDYRHGETALQGFVAYDDGVEGKRPGVLVVHEWRGLGDYARSRAKQLAELGYLAFAVDMYGKGVLAKDHEEAARLVAPFRSVRKLLRERIAAGLAVLREHPLCDGTRIAAIGYCFGGMSVLELARSGAVVRGVVSFHGGLDTPDPADAKNIQGKVLVCHGADDKNVAKCIEPFLEEMRAAKVDWYMMSFGNAVHSFTVPTAGNDPSKGSAYDEAADRRSWEATKDFLAEVLR